MSRSAVKEFEALPSNVIERVREKIRSLARDPRQPGAKKLQGRPEHRVRVGDHRILYTIDDVGQVVDITAISHRGDVYR
ncbi:MAG TPA: type II toxin-antitoxin system RelE/ParE family toxin [Thermoanaerobaculia bacterium]|nr:type II toxin-antitoxin system RelE/ParE family toxin [Thermoanaerobaculia bacterium]